MNIDKKETSKRVYHFLKSYKSLMKLANSTEKRGAFELKALEIVNIIQDYRSNMDEIRSKIFYNLFLAPSNARQNLKDLLSSLNIDKVQYTNLKDEILIDFAKKYRNGALLVYHN